MATINSINVATAAAGKVLQGAGVGVTPTFSTPTYPSASGGAGVILRSDGTNNVYTTSTYPATNTINTLLYASAANVMSALGTANNGVLLTSATGVPSITTAGTVQTPTCVGGTTPGTTVYTVQVGRSIRMGPMVFYSFNVQGTFGVAAAGNVNISIPVIASATTNLNNFGTGSATIGATVFAMGAFQIASGGTVMTFVQSSGTTLPVTLSATFNFQGTITYFVN